MNQVIVSKLLKERHITALKSALETVQPADLAELLETLDEKELPVVFRILPKESAAETFTYLNTRMQQSLIEAFSDKELKEVLDELFVDDTVDIIEEMPANVASRILENSNAESRRMINTILNYPEDSVGSIMTVEYVKLQKSMTVGGAIELIRRVGTDKETIYNCYVTENRNLVGMVEVKDLLTSPDDKSIVDIMETNVISMKTTDDKEEAAIMFNKYDVIALPVVDKQNLLVGIVTVDDAMDVMQEEATEDIEKMAAITPTDKPYLEIGIFDTFKSRIPWLLLLMISATFTGMIITSFEDALKASVVLTAFIPMLMDTGGNSGSQASVTVIRGLALGELDFKDFFKVIWKEIRVSVLCGLALSIVNFGKMYLVDMLLLKTPGLGVWEIAVVCMTLFIAVFVAKLVGCSLPLFAKKLKLDPAVMASPFITTIVDALSLMIYFRIATLILKI